MQKSLDCNLDPADRKKKLLASFNYCLGARKSAIVSYQMIAMMLESMEMMQSLVHLLYAQDQDLRARICPMVR